MGGLLDVFEIWFESSGAMILGMDGVLGLESVCILCETWAVSLFPAGRIYDEAPYFVHTLMHYLLSEFDFEVEPQWAEQQKNDCWLLRHVWRVKTLDRLHTRFCSLQHYIKKILGEIIVWKHFFFFCSFALAGHFLDYIVLSSREAGSCFCCFRWMSVAH